MGFFLRDTGSDLAAGGSLPGRGFYFRREKEPAVNIFWPVIHCCLPLQSCFSYHDFTKQPLHVLTITYGVVAGVLAFLGARSLYKKRQKETGEGAGTYCGRRTEATGISRSLWWQEF
ncbi:MAG: hypothetical protein ACLRMZ_22280 [Blautia marasmi]